MSTGMWILIGLLTLLFSPILIMMIRDYFGLNSNRFYGDEANKNKKNKREEAYEKNSRHSRSIPNNHGGNGPGNTGGNH